MNINFAGGSMTAAAPPWSEMVKYNLNTGEIVWRIPTGVQEAPPEYNIPNNTGVQFPRNAPLVTAGGLIFLATGPERKVHAYDRDTGKELWVHSLPNGAEGMPATYQVNGRQFVVLPVAQPNGTFPATFNNAGGGRAGPQGPRPPVTPGGGRRAGRPTRRCRKGRRPSGSGRRRAGVAGRVHRVRLAAITGASTCFVLGVGVPSEAVRTAAVLILAVVLVCGHAPMRLVAQGRRPSGAPTCRPWRPVRSPSRHACRATWRRCSRIGRSSPSGGTSSPF